MAAVAARAPEPFLPLFGEETLLQATVAGSTARSTDDVTVVTDRRYERLVRDQVPGARSSSSRRAATPPPRSRSPRVAIDRPDDEVMVVLPADHLIAREDVFRAVLRTAADAARDRARSAPTTRWSRSASRPIGRPPSTAT